MVVDVTFKTPDALRDAVMRAVEQEYGDPAQEIEGDIAEELHEENSARRDKVLKFAEHWIRFGETVTIRFNSDEGTAIVLPAH